MRKTRRNFTVQSESGRTYHVEVQPPMLNETMNVTDDKGIRSVFSFENDGQIYKHINAVEKGQAEDIQNFGK